MLRQVVRVALVVTAAGLFGAGTVRADTGGQGTVTTTEHAHDVVLLSGPVVNPCTGAPGAVTAIAANEVLHVTFFTASDEFWVTGTDEGSVTFTPDDPSGVSASGQFASWFGESFNQKNDVQHFTNTFNLRGTDGSRLVVHETAHLGTNGSGDVTVDFDKMNVTCG